MRLATPRVAVHEAADSARGAWLRVCGYAGAVGPAEMRHDGRVLGGALMLVDEASRGMVTLSLSPNVGTIAGDGDPRSACVFGAGISNGSATTMLHTGESSTTTDADSKVRAIREDGLGRIVEVTEAPGVGGFGWTTTYAYDALDRLVGVTQGSQIRSFTYDTMGWLRTAMNPEKLAPDVYDYDDNGNLITRSDPNGSVTNFSPTEAPIDALNRVQKKTYTAGAGAAATGAVTYTWDNCANGKARLCSISNAESSVTYTYDAGGRIDASTQAIGSTSYPFHYEYNLADALKAITYPSGRQVTYGMNGGGQVTSVMGTRAGETARTYASGVQYAPHGAVRQMTLGNTRVETTEFNDRLQVKQIGLGSSAASPDLLEIELYYCPSQAVTCTTNNGNVISQQVSRPTSEGGMLKLLQTYGYDAVNRLTSMNEAIAAGATGADWSVHYGYDRYGNQWVTGETTVPMNLAAVRAQGQIDAGRNRISATYNNQPMPADGYDSAGNLKNHPEMGRMSYDVEGRLASYASSGTVMFGYDGEGRRVRKTANAGTTWYVYDAELSMKVLIVARQTGTGLVMAASQPSICLSTGILLKERKLKALL